MNTFPPAPGGWQWSDSVGEEVKKVIEEALAPVIDSREMRDIREERESSAKEDSEVFKNKTSLSTWPESAKAWEAKVDDYLNGRETKRHIKLTAKVQGHDTYFCIDEGANPILQLKTGIGSNEMAFLFEDYMIPFRDAFEKLGFAVTEEVAVFNKE